MVNFSIFLEVRNHPTFKRQRSIFLDSWTPRQWGRQNSFFKHLKLIAEGGFSILILNEMNRQVFLGREPSLLGAGQTC